VTIRLVEIGESGFIKVLDADGNYLGVLTEVEGRFRTYGTRVGLDGRLVSMEREFPTLDEAKAWLQDGAES
jgi:hypothetical protein